jgi:hypothetical protein
VQDTCSQIAAHLIAAAALPLDSVECLVLLQTAPITVLPMDGYLVINRTFADVSPDTGSIAIAIGHALAHMSIGSVADPALLLNRKGPAQLLQDLEASYVAAREDEIDKLTLKILESSDYRTSLSGAGGFLDIVNSLSSRLPALLGPAFVRHADSTQTLRRSALMANRPFDCRAADAVCGLPIASRILINPNTNQLELRKVVTLPAPGEDKNVLGLNAFFPTFEHIAANASD